MKIKRKAPKPSPTKAPLYIIGYSFALPSSAELTAWYDREYGGPLRVTATPNASGGWLASHGPWTAHVQIPIPPEQAEQVKEGLVWEHENLGRITPAPARPGTITDTILLAARLARGLTLLTQGTAFDVTMNRYLNPSDWQDCDLASFLVRDHIAVSQGDASTEEVEWVYTLGMRKFGLDELETFRPKGLPVDEAMEVLTEAADEILRAGHSPKVGTALRLSLLGRTVEVVRHRTASPAGRMVSFRELRL